MTANAVDAGATRAAWRSSRLLTIYALVITAAWGLSLWAEFSGTAGLVHHHSLYHSGLAFWIALLVAMLAWQAMTAAMMLPSSLPFMLLFARASARDPRHGLAVSLFTASYFTVWTLFAGWAMGFDWLLHEFVHQTPWLLAHDNVISGAIFLVAAAFQVSPLKRACLRSCRNPGVYLMRRYRRGALAGARLGFEHGLYCLGCCWALMLVMFAAGIAHLAWMGLFALIMLIENAAPRGERIVVPVAVGLALLAAMALAMPGSIGI